MAGEPGERSAALPGAGLAAVSTVQDLASLLRRLRRREARRRGGSELTYRELAARTGWSFAIIGQYFTGQVLPPTDRFDVLVALLGATPAERGALATARDRVEEARRGLAAPGGVAEERQVRRQPSADLWPHRVGTVPPLADCRQRRQADYDLDMVAEPGGTAVVCQMLSGLGGVGKTQLAAGLAHRVWQRREVDLLVWVTATARASIIARYAQAAGDVTGIEDPDPEQAAARFLAWLAGPNARRWLIVLDDLADPADLDRLWPPATPLGRTVVTTRRRDPALTGHRDRRLINVGIFTPAESTRYLREKLGHHPERSAGADKLAEALGHLPLALAQAAAYILERDLNCTTYRARLADRRKRLADLAPDALPDEHRTTVATTWSLSIEHANTLKPAGLAGPILELASMLDPNGIPAAVFTTPATRSYLASRRTTGNPAATAGNKDPVEIDDAVEALHCPRRLNLLTLDTGTTRVHALVQRAIRDALTPEQAAIAAKAAADALVESWPEIERDTAVGQAFRTNAAALGQHAGDLLRHPPVHPVLFRTGRSLGEAGQLTAAAAHFEQLLTECQPVLGADHPDTLTIRYHLVRWRGEAGDHAGAAIAAEEVLADRVRMLGPDHPDTLASRHNLTYHRGMAGDPAGAAAAFEEVLADRVRVLGPDHPDTLVTRGHVAYWRGRAGDPAGATRAYEEVLADRLRVLGPDHPNTLSARRNLGYWRGAAGDPAGATAALERVLADCLRVLGPDHPYTLFTRHDLAYWRGTAGDPSGAAAALEEMHADCMRVLGHDHPDTLSVRSSLARWRQAIPQAVTARPRPLPPGR